MVAWDDRHWDLVDDAVGQFEQSGQAGAGIDPGGYLPPADDPRRRQVLVTLIQIDQERRWQAGRRPLVEEYLGAWPELKTSPEHVRELLEGECRTRAAAGEPLTLDELRSRFTDPDLQIDFETILAGAERECFPGAEDAQRETSHETDTTEKPGVKPNANDRKLQPGDRLGPYEIERELSSGGMGTVYLAKHTDLGARRAVKVPARGLYESSDQVELFLNEGRLAAQLKHPAIVSVHEFGRREDGACYLVMEYVEGKTLAELLQAGEVSREEAVEWVVQVAEVLQYAHQQGVIHRDVKPANILIDKQGRAHVADFGLAVHEALQQQRAGELSGSLPYMSPEQVRGETHWEDGRADIWSLGVVLYELLSARRPFLGETVGQLIQQILHREPKPPSQIDPTIPARLEDVCLKCLKKSVTERYSNTGTLARDVRHWRRPWRRWVVGVLAAALLVAVATPLFLPGGKIETRPLTCVKMDVIVWNPEKPSRSRLNVKDLHTLPLQDEDLVRVDVELNRDAYPYLFLIDTEGAVWPIYPWPPGSWDDRPSKESPTRRVSLPRVSGEGWPVTGPPGMDTLVLLARDTPLPDDVCMEDMLAGLPRQEMQDAKAFVEFDNWQPVVPVDDRQERGMRFDRTRIADPVLETQRLLQQRVEKYFDTHHAISYSNAAE